jgi:hypothetical protein
MLSKAKFTECITSFFAYFEASKVSENPLAFKAWYLGLNELNDEDLEPALILVIQQCDRHYLPSPKKILDLYWSDRKHIESLNAWQSVVMAIKSSESDRKAILDKLDLASEKALAAMGGITNLIENVKPENLHSWEQKRFLENRAKYDQAIRRGEIKEQKRIESKGKTLDKIEDILQETEYDSVYWQEIRKRLETTVQKTEKLEIKEPPVVDLVKHRQEMCDRANQQLRESNNRIETADFIEKSGYLKVIRVSGIPARVVLKDKTEDF